VPRARFPGAGGRITEWRNRILPAYRRLTRRTEALIAAIEEWTISALDTVTAQDARSWLRHCGYASHRPENRNAARVCADASLLSPG
jgi:hypothetical protein